MTFCLLYFMVLGLGLMHLCSYASDKHLLLIITAYVLLLVLGCWLMTLDPDQSRLPIFVFGVFFVFGLLELRERGRDESGK